MKKIILKKLSVFQGGARNIGIQIAKGQYLIFVDGDDWIEKEMCESLYDEAKQSHADIVYCNIFRQRENDYLIANRFSREAVGEVDEKVKELLIQQCVGPCAHMIKRKLIIDNNLFFPEHLVGEDTAITKLWDLHARQISKISGAYYVYCLNKESTGQAERKVYRNDEFECIKILYDNLKQYSKVDLYRTEQSLICLRYALDVAKNKCNKSEKNFKIEIEQGFRDCVKHVCGDITERALWKYWFTPKEQECLLAGMYRQEDQIGTVEDYRQYYNLLEDEIRKLIEWLKLRGNVKLAIWSKTNYAVGMYNAFGEMAVIDNVEEVEEKGVECVICLRSLHIENAKKQLSKRKIDIFNLQGYLWNGGDMSKFLYVAK